MINFEKYISSLSVNIIIGVRLVLSVAAVFAVTDISKAQSISVMPNDSITISGNLEDLETLSIQQYNTSNDTICLKWRKVFESVPAFWDASICDNSNCYTSLVDSGIMNPVNPNDYGFLLIHITPHVNYGTAVISYVIWDNSSPNLIDTLTYILTANIVTANNFFETSGFVNVYPNPAQDVINVNSSLQSGFKYLIIDSAGKEIQSINLNGFQNGWYQIRIFDGFKTIGSKNILIQK
jgi:hypothetical protein